MNELELTQKILDYIETNYEANYIGLVQVIKSNFDYQFKLGIPSYMAPTMISGNWETDEDFLNYIYKELKTRNYVRQDYYRVVRLKDGESIDKPSKPERLIISKDLKNNIFPYTLPFILT
jgi:hypothetical protein